MSLKRLVGAIILKLTYGYNVDYKSGFPLVKPLGQVGEEASDASQPGRWLIDVIPIRKSCTMSLKEKLAWELVRYLPSWMPSTGFQKIANKYRCGLHEMIEVPYSFIKKNIDSGNALPSFVSLLIEKGNLSQ